MIIMLFGRLSVQKAIFLIVLGNVVLLLFHFLKTPHTYARLKSVITNIPDNKTEPISDTITPQSARQLIEEIEKELPQIPIRFWEKNAGLKLNSTCARFPQLLDLQYNNIYWQTLHTSNGTFQLLNAYFDNRKYNELGPTVRLLSMVNRADPNVTTYCQIWYDDQDVPIIIKSREYAYVWRKEWRLYKEGQYEAYLVSCDVPKNGNAPPVAVSLVEHECDTASNLLKIIHNTVKTKKDFAVCVKGLDYPNADFSVRLVEWIELLHILGANMIYFYEFSVHPNISKVLNYYQRQGKAEVSLFQLAGEQPNLPALRSYYFQNRVQQKRVNEIVPYNDCFYKHMHQYRYIVLLDIDEVIIPNKVYSWQKLLAELEREKKETTSYSAQNLYFFDSINHEHKWFLDIPKYMHMLQHVYRSFNFTIGQYVKSFFNTEKVLILHNHYPIACFNHCQKYDIEFHHAQLQHYRSDCVSELKKKCASFKNNTVIDTHIWKYKQPLIERVRETLEKLGFLEKLA